MVHLKRARLQNNMNENNNITIEVATDYIDAQSQPDLGRYVFSYTITIENHGAEAARLMSRHWVITDANGKIQEVSGDGVVGKQPRLSPGQKFRYSSGAVLETPVGSMQGRYHMEADCGTNFVAPIPAFTLAVPGILH